MVRAAAPSPQVPARKRKVPAPEVQSRPSEARSRAPERRNRVRHAKVPTPLLQERESERKVDAFLTRKAKNTREVPAGKRSLVTSLRQERASRRWLRPGELRSRTGYVTSNASGNHDTAAVANWGNPGPEPPNGWPRPSRPLGSLCRARRLWHLPSLCAHPNPPTGSWGGSEVSKQSDGKTKKTAW
jgi:hypothetical protein